MPVLYPFQEIGRDFLVARPRAMLCDPPGCGKTPTTLAALREVSAQRTLVVAPKAVVGHWIKLASLWYPEATVVDGRGSRAAREKARTAVRGRRRPDDPPTILVLNYEAMRQDRDDLVKIPFDALVTDEGHRLKSRAALQTRAAGMLARRSTRCWVLTGTPMLNRPDELWSLLNLLDGQRWRSYWRWVGEWMLTRPARYPGASQWATEVIGLKPGAAAGIRRELAPVMLQRPLELLLPDLPPVTVTVLEVELDEEERRYYSELKKRHWTTLESGKVIAVVNKVSLITRMRQITSNLDALGARRERPGTKIATAVELIEDLGDEQVVTLGWTRAAAERIAAETGGVAIHGGLSNAERKKALEAFVAGDARVVAGTYGVLGEGVDGLQVARHLILIDRPWRPADEEQAIGRLRRSGQEAAVSVTILVAKGTVDEAISALLERKQSVIDAITRGELQP